MGQPIGVKGGIGRWLTALCTVVTAFVLLPVSAQAANPTTVSFQGKVVNADGTNVTDGTYSFTFRLYTVGTGGIAVWTETQTSVPVTAGVFQVKLGSVCPLFTANTCNNNTPIDFNVLNSLHLGITFNGDAAGEMTPRVQLQSVPYAFNSDRVGGFTAAQLVQLSPASQQAGFINVSGASTFAGGLTVNGGAVLVNNTGANNTTIGGSTGTLQLGGTGAGAVTLQSASTLAIDTLNFDVSTAGAITAATTGNTINGLVVNAGALSGITNIVLSGSISGGTTITGTTINGTAGINTGAGAGTQRIDASGNIVNAGNFTATAGSLFSSTGANGFTFRPGINNTSALRVDNANGTAVFQIDTTTPNRVTNPGFGDDTAGWFADGSATISRTVAENHVGLSSLQINATAQNAGARTNSFTQPITSNTQYTFSFYAKAATSFTGFAAGYSNNGSTKTACTLTSTTVIAGGWSRHSCTFTTGTVSGSPFVYINQTNNVTRTFFIDSVQLTQGATVTPYQIGGVQVRGIFQEPAAFMSFSNSTNAFQIQNSTATNNLFIADTVNNFIGINTASAAYALDVNGQINASTGFRFNGTAGQTVTCGNNQYLNQVVVQGGIVTGSNGCNGVGLSDQRLKTNVVALDGEILNRMRSVRAVAFDFDCTNEYFDQTNTYCDTDRQAGVLAQELAQIFPDLVTQNENGFFEVDYQGLSVYNLRATAELAQYIDADGNANLKNLSVEGSIAFDAVMSPALISKGALVIDASKDATVAIGKDSGAVSLAEVGTQTTVKGALIVDGETQLNGAIKGGALVIDTPNFNLDGSGNLTSNGSITTKGGSVQILAADGKQLVRIGQDGADFSGHLNIATVTVNGALTVNGDTTFAGLTTFQKLAVFIGTTVFRQDVTFESHITVANDTAGYVQFKPGQTTVHVEFAREYATKPVVSLTTDGGKFTSYAVNNVTTKGFDVVLQTPSTEELQLNWVVFGVNAPRTATGPEVVTAQP